MSNERECDCVDCDLSFPTIHLIDGRCGMCRLKLKVEINSGVRKLERYLDKWARFREWEVAHR